MNINTKEKIILASILLFTNLLVANGFPVVFIVMITLGLLAFDNREYIRNLYEKIKLKIAKLKK